MASAIPSLLVTYEGDTGLMGFTSTSQGFFMLGSGPNLNNVSAGGSETDTQTPYPAGRDGMDSLPGKHLIGKLH
jgi:hypothetical protein